MVLYRGISGFALSNNIHIGDLTSVSGMHARCKGGGRCLRHRCVDGGGGRDRGGHSDGFLCSPSCLPARSLCAGCYGGTSPGVRIGMASVRGATCGSPTEIFLRSRCPSAYQDFWYSRLKEKTQKNTANAIQKVTKRNRKGLATNGAL